jgi:hypothetical protein
VTPTAHTLGQGQGKQARGSKGPTWQPRDGCDKCVLTTPGGGTNLPASAWRPVGRGPGPGRRAVPWVVHVVLRLRYGRVVLRVLLLVWVLQGRHRQWLRARRWRHGLAVRRLRLVLVLVVTRVLILLERLHGAPAAQAHCHPQPRLRTPRRSSSSSSSSFSSSSSSSSSSS